MKITILSVCLLAFLFTFSTQTAASVTVIGRVTSVKGGGIKNVRVTMTDSNGETRTASSNSLDYYSFADIPAGETYIFTVFSKRYTFN